MGRRTLLLIASILVAALGTALVFLYVQGADSRATANQALVSVYLSGQAIAPGTKIDSKLQSSFTKSMLPQQSVDELGAVRDLTKIQGQFALQTVPAGAMLFGYMFGAQAPAISPFVIDKGHVAVSVSLANPMRVSLLRANAKVAIFLTGSPRAGAAKETRLLFPSVRVLDVAGEIAAPSAQGQTVPQTAVTLELSQDDAMKIIQAQSDGGQLWFALPNSDTALSTSASAVTTSELYP